MIQAAKKAIGPTRDYSGCERVIGFMRHGRSCSVVFARGRYQLRRHGVVIAERPTMELARNLAMKFLETMHSDH